MTPPLPSASLLARCLRVWRRAVAVRPCAGGLCVLIVACVALGCSAPPDNAAPAASTVSSGAAPEEVARLWLTGESPLPGRAEVVALSDTLSIEASRAEVPEDLARLSLLAAELRERLWRYDRVATDAREASELYAAAARAAARSELSCSADRRRALLLAVLELDAPRAYGELYLALRRQRWGDGPATTAHARCVADLEAALQVIEAYRPSGPAWDELVAQGDQAASSYREKPPPRPPVAGSTATASSASAASATPAPVLRDVVVAPDEVADGPVELLQVQPFSWEGGARVVLTLSAPARYEVGAVAADAATGKGQRIFLDIARAKPKRLPREVVSTGLVERVRLGQQRDGMRVVLDLAGPVNRRVFFLPEPFRVVIDVSPPQPTVVAPTTTAGERLVRRVVLDPGHGGWDDGAVGPTGLREKDVTLDIAHRAAPALAHELGIETLITRDTDTYVYLEERTARANAYRADLFVSIHCNATENGSAQGFEIYVLDPSRGLDAAATRTAARENTAGKVRSASDQRAVEQQVSTVAAGLGFGNTIAESRRLAELLAQATQASLVERYGSARDHGLRTAGFYVLVGAEMPAVLFETAFISNPDDEARLATADFRQKIADAIVNSIRAFRDGR